MKFKNGHPIFTIGSGQRVQYHMQPDGFWWKRCRRPSGQVGWTAWITTGSKQRPENIWYNPGAGRAHLTKE